MSTKLNQLYQAYQIESSWSWHWNDSCSRIRVISEQILRFYEIHSDHLDANMIHSSKSNGNPCMKMTCFIKTMKIHYVLKGINGNPCTKMTKNGNNKKHILRFYEIHSDHLDANMIRSSRSNGKSWC